MRWVQRTPAVSTPVSPPDWQGVFPAALPFAVIAGMALIDVPTDPPPVRCMVQLLRYANIDCCR